MALTLPWIVILAALFYLVASKAGWLEALGKRSQQRGQVKRRRGPGEPVGPDDEGAVRRRLQVFEEFLSGLGRDDSDKDA
jgi:hypothetical protein